jgi:glycosyltransferase involved in cell wall biosynthesis
MVKVVTNVFRVAPVGGVELHVFQTSRELARRGYDIDLLYVEPGSLESEYRSFCHSVTRVRAVDYWFPAGRRARPGQLLDVAPAAWQAVRRRPDLIYANRVFSTAWAVPAGRVSRAPVVCHLHGHTPLEPRRVAALNRHVGRFVIISQFVADLWLASGLDPDKIDVVFNGIDPSEYPPGGMGERASTRRSLGVPEDAFVITYFGRLDREKGVDVLLRAWQALGLGPSEARLLVVGSSMVDQDGGRFEEELRSLATDSVEFLGARRDVVTPLHAADIIVIPSTWDEPFGRTVIEGLSTGRVVLASRVGGIPEILAGPLEPFLFERGDAPGLAAKIRTFRHWRDEDPGLATVCTERVQQGFTLKDMVDGVEASFARVR